MSICTIRSPLHFDEHTSARPRRRAGTHLRAVPAPGAAVAPDEVIERGKSAPAADGQILRRWSVAELIASASWPPEAA
jgi:hypothetical protein